MKVNFVIYKVFRIFYASYFYYFMPFTVIWIPYLYEYGDAGVLERTESMVTEDLFTKYA